MNKEYIVDENISDEKMGFLGKNFKEQTEKKGFLGVRKNDDLRFKIQNLENNVFKLTQIINTLNEKIEHLKNNQKDLSKDEIIYESGELVAHIDAQTIPVWSGKEQEWIDSAKKLNLKWFAISKPNVDFEKVSDSKKESTDN